MKRRQKGREEEQRRDKMRRIKDEGVKKSLPVEEKG